MNVRIAGLLALLAVGAPARLCSQVPLTLPEVLERADRLAYANRIAAAQRQVSQGEAAAAFRGVLPSVRAEAGWMRTTDPLNAFGFTLRQRAVTPAAFDPDRLNHPDPISSVGSALVLEQPLVNLDAWAGRRAATSAAAAAGASERWAAGSTRVAVVRAWYGGVLAAEKAGTLQDAVAAAQSHVRQASSLLEQGMVTRADFLLAQVKAGELEADLAAARGDLAVATRQLALVIGTPQDTSLQLPDRLPDATVLDTELSRIVQDPGNPAARGDVDAARLGAVAADRDLARSRAAVLPRLNGFARYDWNAPTALFGGQKAWTIGVMASWSPFSGGGELAAIQAARGRATMAAVGAEQATAHASLDAAQRDNALQVARIRLAIAERAVAQSAEAHRLVSRSYAGGLATVTELLGAAAAETGSRLARSAALFDVLVAAAERQQARGLSLDFLIALGR